MTSPFGPFVLEHYRLVATGQNGRCSSPVPRLRISLSKRQSMSSWSSVRSWLLLHSVNLNTHCSIIKISCTLYFDKLQVDVQFHRIAHDNVSGFGHRAPVQVKILSVDFPCHFEPCLGLSIGIHSNSVE